LQVNIGSGSYGTIFSALYVSGDIYKHVAIKIEKNARSFTLQANEVQIMKIMAKNKHFAKFYQCGTQEGFKYVAMELLGPSLMYIMTIIIVNKT
jgi:serine/threonine protein kinase